MVVLVVILVVCVCMVVECNMLWCVLVAGGAVGVAMRCIEVIMGRKIYECIYDWRGCCKYGLRSLGLQIRVYGRK